jgi:hypothetical protein
MRNDKNLPQGLVEPEVGLDQASSLRDTSFLRAAHRTLCAQREISPSSFAGQDLAKRILSMASDCDDILSLLRRFLH